mgnify:FL=1
MTSHGHDYKNFSDYNRKSEGSIQGPAYNGPAMNVQKIPQYDPAINLQYGHGFVSYKKAYSDKPNQSNCGVNFNFKDCNGKVVSEANGQVINNQGQYTQAKYDAV